MSRRRRGLVLAFVAVPAAAAILVTAWRVGTAWRQRVTTADLELAVEVAARWDSVRTAAADTAPLVGRVTDRGGRLLYDHALYRRHDDVLERAAGASSLPARLPRELVAELERLDRPFRRRIDGRPASVVPVRDRAGWAIVGAVVLARATPLPAALPGPALAWGALAWLLAMTGGLGFAVSGAPAASAMAPAQDAVRARSPGRRLAPPAAAVLTLLPLAGYAAWAVMEGGGVGVLVAMGAALVAAVIGLSLVHTAADQGLRLRNALTAWSFLAPSFLHLLLFSIGPILFCFYLSFHQWNLVESARPFVGLANYRALLGDAAFGRALLNTAVYVLFVPAGMVVALGLALLVNRRFRGVGLLRTIFFLPYITSFVAISLVWKWMFEPDFGLLNNVLGRLGLDGLPWLSSPATALPSLMLMSIWMYAGYMMVLFLAGLQNIPESLYESARIDGASAWQRFRHITLPMLRPTTFFVLVTMVIFMFQVFTAVYVMTEGGPLHATDVIVYHIYRNAWEYLRMGYASAMAWVLFAVVFLITLGQWRWLGGRAAQ